MTSDPAASKTLSRLQSFSLCIFGGILMALAFLPFDISVLVWVGLLPLLTVLWRRPRSFWGSFGYGWIYGMAYYCTSFWWIHEVSYVFGIPMPVFLGIAFFPLMSYYALFPALWAAIGATYLRPRLSPTPTCESNSPADTKKAAWKEWAALDTLSTLRSATGLAALWVCIEWLRAHGTLGFSWNSLGMALYDVGRLYDTIPSQFYNDKSYTPSGRNSWNRERYQRKLENIVSVIDTLQMPIVALSGVENEEVVREIVSRSNQDYSYLHRTIDYYDGLDFALLYYGDILFIKSAHATNHTLIIEAKIYGHTITLHLTRAGSRLRTTLPHNSDSPSDITVAWGRLSRDDLRRLKMDDPLREREIKGEGDSKSNQSWVFKNRIGVSTTNEYKIESGVYISRRLLTSDGRAPLSTFASDRYMGGYSSYLPLYLYITTP